MSPCRFEGSGAIVRSGGVKHGLFSQGSYCSPRTGTRLCQLGLTAGDNFSDPLDISEWCRGRFVELRRRDDVGGDGVYDCNWCKP